MCKNLYRLNDATIKGGLVYQRIEKDKYELGKEIFDIVYFKQNDLVVMLKKNHIKFINNFIKQSIVLHIRTGKITAVNNVALTKV